jgi:hypothetical protein
MDRLAIYLQDYDENIGFAVFGLGGLIAILIPVLIWHCRTADRSRRSMNKNNQKIEDLEHGIELLVSKLANRKIG